MNIKTASIRAVSALASGILLAAPFTASAAPSTGNPPALLPKRDHGTAVIANPMSIEQALGREKFGYSSDADELGVRLKDHNTVGPLTTKSIDGGNVNVGDEFLYQYDSQTPGAASDGWSMTTKLDTAHDKFTGAWAVYELHAGQPVYRLAGNSYKKTQSILIDKLTDVWSQYGELFTATEGNDGTVTISATPEYLKWRSNKSSAKNVSLRVYIQCKRIAPGEKIANTSTEIVGKGEDSAEAPSNTVTTSSTDLTPGITVTEDSGKVTVTNTSKGDKNGAQFQAKDLKFTNLKDIAYPKDWNKLTLKPGQGITLNGVVADASKPVTVSATPVSTCSTPNSDPFDPYLELLKGISGNLITTMVESEGNQVYLSEVYFPESGYTKDKASGMWKTSKAVNQDTVTLNGVQLCRASAITASTPTPASTVTATPAPSAAPSPAAAKGSAAQGGNNAAAQDGAAGKAQLASTGSAVAGLLAVALILTVGSAVSLRVLSGYSRRAK